jgi:uncharacterized protein YggU (UPF0235/DUF167 family)
VEVIAAARAGPKSAVSVVGGELGRDKRVRVAGIDRTTAELRLATVLR